MHQHGLGWDEARARNDWQAMAHQWARERGRSRWTEPIGETGALVMVGVIAVECLLLWFVLWR